MKEFTYNDYAFPPDPVMHYREKTLEAIRLAVITRLNNQLLHGVQRVEMDSMVDLMVDQTVMKLEAVVWSDPSQSHTEEVALSVPSGHPTWKHQLVANLPENSFRRRWMCFFYGIPLDYKAAKITKTFKVHVPAVLPELQRELPPDFGRYHFPIQINEVYGA